MPDLDATRPNESLLDYLACRCNRPRRYLRCETCLDFGMMEDADGREDVCPTCEGGIWRERESWRWWVHHQPWFGFRVLIGFSGFPLIVRDRPA